MKSRITHIQDLYLEQAALGELTEEKTEELQRIAGATSVTFSTEVANLQRQNTDFHHSFDPKTTLDAIRERAFSENMNQERRSVFAQDVKVQKNSSIAHASNAPTGNEVKPENHQSWGRLGKWTAAIAAVVPIALILGITLFNSANPNPYADSLEPEVRSKGLEPRIFIYRDLGEGEVELLEDQDRAQAGDKLQISYLAVGQNFGCIISIDGSAVITLHYPENSNMLPRLQPSDEVYLPYGYRLDDAPDFERFFFITSEEAFDVRELMASISPQLHGAGWRRSGRIELPEDFTVYQLDLLKNAGNR